jgi:hypothetical protein
MGATRTLRRAVPSARHQELLNHGRRSRRSFFLRYVPEVIENHQSAAVNVTVEVFGVLGRHQPIAATP